MPETPKDAKARTAILVRCTPEEAELIRRAAHNERRTLSGFILNAVMNRLRARAELASRNAPALRRKDDI